MFGSHYNPLDIRFASSLGRMMIFVDGENLTIRYQNTVREGWVPREDVTHIKDTLIWNEGAAFLADGFTVIRAYYYTSVQGADSKLDEVRYTIKNLTYPLSFGTRDINTFTPWVFKKERSNGLGVKAKGVDIQMTIDILSHVYKNNVDAIYLLSGDGDYVPILEEVIRQGKRVYTAAFKSGCSPKIPLISDQHYWLDSNFFPPGAPKKENGEESKDQ
jgi:uncharacterized LabA/DUF88 family protein